MRGWHWGSRMGTPIPAFSLRSSFPAEERHQKKKKQVVSVARYFDTPTDKRCACVYLYLGFNWDLNLDPSTLETFIVPLVKA